MGKVLSAFENGFLGAGSRAVDEIVLSCPVSASGGIGFGLPAVWNAQKTGVIPFASTHTADDFIGVTRRSADKTPDAYGSNEAQYNRKEIAEIIVRGSVVVNCYSGTPAPDGAVYVVKANGKFSAEASTSGADNVLLPDVKWRGPKDNFNRAELVILKRNA